MLTASLLQIVTINANRRQNRTTKTLFRTQTDSSKGAQRQLTVSANSNQRMIELNDMSTTEYEKVRVTGAEALLISLLAEGVKTLFGYPGGAIIPVYDHLYGCTDRLHHILPRHEQGAEHAAQGFARATGQVGVTLATSGPGATNLVTGIADAMIDSTPLVCNPAQVAASAHGSDAFQEADIISMTMPVTIWNFQITRAEEIPGAIAKAFYIARSGRPGPVVIDFTKNAQTEMLDFHYTPCTS